MPSPNHSAQPSPESAAQPSPEPARNAGTPAQQPDAETSTPAPGTAAAKKKGWSFWLGETILTVAAVFGLLCVAVALAAHLWGVHIILFKTGSMAPTIPAGSMALVKEIPASQVQVGDVVTVERPGQMPITHRVVSTQPDPDGDAATRIIEMKGDANPSPDPLPYEVTEVQRVFFSQPGLAKVIVMLSNPLLLGAIALSVSLLVIWALWPQD